MRPNASASGARVPCKQDATHIRMTDSLAGCFTLGCTGFAAGIWLMTCGMRFSDDVGGEGWRGADKAQVCQSIKGGMQVAVLIIQALQRLFDVAVI